MENTRCHAYCHTHYNNVLQVVEYSEISSNITNQRNRDGSLTFSAGNICNHYFTLAFLRDICSTHYDQLPHHVAQKKIPCINEEGERLEREGDQ